ncbi:MAG: hypothetical protein ACD_79C00643G0003 [uncultured bacterium]|nr:MAG: hypothetical protein ACD_79C00643G0003 [uncultured bacterium]
MSIATDYISRDEYDREWEPKYQALEKKYADDAGNLTGDSNEYNADIEKLDYYYAKAVANRIQQKIAEILEHSKSAIERNDYNEFEENLKKVQKIWGDFNTPFHYKMNARGILEKD